MQLPELKAIKFHAIPAMPSRQLGVADSEVLVCSTGLIGILMDAEPLVKNIQDTGLSTRCNPEAGTLQRRRS